MRVVYTHERISEDGVSCFLAGPTPVREDVKSWRKDAIKFFEKYNFKGTLYVPEFRDKSYYDDKIGLCEIKWDQSALESASAVMFWIPRSRNMLGLSTNVEFGFLISKGNMIYGRPSSAFKCLFLDYLYEEKLNRKPSETLEETVVKVIEYLKDGSYE